MAFTSVAMQSSGVAMSTVGAYNAARGTQDALRGQADIADINARLAELGAQSTLLAGQRQEQSVLLKGSQLKSTQRTNLAANGIDLGSPTATNILTTTDVMKEVDANTVKANAVRQAWGYRTQASNYQIDAILKRGTANSINPTMQATATFIEGAGKVAASWYTMNKLGAFSNDVPADVKAANMTEDPIYSLGSQRNWWSK